MLTTTSQDISTVVKNSTPDVVIFMNNVKGKWDSDSNTVSLRALFPKSYEYDRLKVEASKRVIGTFQVPVNESVSTTMLNVYTRKCDRSMVEIDQTKHLCKALELLSKQLYNKKIVILAHKTVSVKSVKDYAERHLSGNMVTLVL